jgi:uncharacterized 2Fe-2S/4Fe-4S cluster protein (DUF4445 family)
MDHFRVNFKPDNKSIIIHAGATVLEAAAQAGIILDTTCGGKGTCKKCQVWLLPDNREVLACQYRINSELDVMIPVTSRFFEQKILEHGGGRDIELSPLITKKIVDNKTIVYRDGVAVCSEQGDTSSEVYGVAVDIGTTTVVAKLIDLKNGQAIATAASGNPQIVFGDDVISRIAYGHTEQGFSELHDVIIYCVNTLIKQLCHSAQIKAEYIYELTVAGNTTMNHLLLKLPISQLGQAPYKAYSVDAFDKSADELRIKINPAGHIHTIENIAGFVGSDTVAAAVAVAMDEADEMTLLVDIGTNGEILLGTKKKMYAASCAAGPAFEGAIERVVHNPDDIDVDVIGGKTPRTICGSGLIDAVALLVELGIVDSTGKFVSPIELKGKLPQKIFDRIIEQGEKQYAFVLAHNLAADEKPVILTQKDIRETQLAKAAISAGIKLLQKKIGITDNDIEHVLLAGAFGNYIRRKSAKLIGLLPDVPLEKIHFVGNAASSGAQMILISGICRDLAGKLARQIDYIELANEPEFAKQFAESMSF